MPPIIEVKRTTIKYVSLEDPYSSVKIRKVNLNPSTNSQTFKYPYGQYITITQNPPSFEALFLDIHGELIPRKPFDNWTNDSVDFITKNSRTKVIFDLRVH